MKAIQRARERAKGNGIPRAKRDKVAEARSTALTARLFWGGLHIGMLFVLLFIPSDLQRWLAVGSHGATPAWWSLLGLGLLLALNFLTYFQVIDSDPGYVDRDEQPPHQVQEMLTCAALEVPRTRRLPVSQLYTGKTDTGENAAQGEASTSVEVGEGSEDEIRVFVSADGDDDSDLSSNDDDGLLGGSKNAEVQRYGRECPYCIKWQPVRAKHCHECGRCVQRFDHHCFWVGTCIGQRNHGRFWRYLSTQLLLLVWVVSLNSSAYVYRPTFETWVEANLIQLVMSLVLYCFTVFVLSLWGLHTFLILTNQTTWEVTKRCNISYLNKVPDNVQPFNRGLKQNLREYCLGEVNEPYVLPTNETLQEESKRETFWENRYYSCC